MFKLSSLFVEIKGEDSALQSKIGAIKDQLGTVGVAIGSAIGGLATAGISVAIPYVTDFVKSTIADSEELTKAWEDIKAPFTETFETMKTVATEALGSIMETLKPLIITFATGLTGALKLVQGVIEQNKGTIDAFMSGVKSTFDTLQIGAEAAIEQFGKIQEAIQPAIDAVLKLPAAIQAAFTGGSLSAVTAWGQAIKTWVTDALDLAGVAIRNWPDFLEIASIQIYEKILNIGEFFATIPENASRVGNYLANNWKQLIVDALNSVGAAFTNFGANIAAAWDATLKGFQTGKFEYSWKPLLDGFKATADKLPEMVRPAFSDFSDQVREIEERIGKREAERKPRTVAEKAQEAAEEASAEQAAQANKFKSQTLGVAEFAAQQRAAIYSKEDDTPKKTLAAAERTAKATEKIAEEPEPAGRLGP